jgi:hypothetical protein
VEVVELSDQTNSFTEFEIRYPVVVDGEEQIITKLSNLFLRFALINLHIAFSIELPGMAIFDILQYKLSPRNGVIKSVYGVTPRKILKN